MSYIDPRLGDTRIKSWFAFWPVYIGRETRWLERVTVRQMYFEKIDWYTCQWQNIEFIDEKTN